MAGLVNVYKSEGAAGCINIGSISLDHLVKYLKLCQTTSPILRAESDFDPWGAYAGSNWVTFDGY